MYEQYKKLRVSMKNKELILDFIKFINYDANTYYGDIYNFGISKIKDKDFLKFNLFNKFPRDYKTFYFSIFNDNEFYDFDNGEFTYFGASEERKKIKANVKEFIKIINDHKQYQAYSLSKKLESELDNKTTNKRVKI